jgi:hypothetical protein
MVNPFQNLCICRRVEHSKKERATMSSHYGRSPLRSHPVSRRQLLLGMAGVALAGAPGSRHTTIAASGQLDGANLVELATYTGWRTTWDLIVPVLTDRVFPRTFLRYDRAAGEAELIAVDAEGGLRQIRRILEWRTTWDIIVPSRFPRLSGVTGLIAYDRTAGLVTTVMIDAFGNLQELDNFPNWRKTWTALTPYGPDGLLAYDRAAGFATAFTIDTSGIPRELRSYNDWRQTWDLLTSGPFTTGDLPGSSLLRYDRSAGQASGLTIGSDGQITLFADYAGWPQNWSEMIGGLFLFQGFAGSASADLLLFDQTAQELEFLDIGPGSSLVSILQTPAPGVSVWTTVAVIGPDLVLLYDRATGTAGLYVTNQVPVVTPTPTPVPPTPTPVPPTPTPVPPTPTPEVFPNERFNVRLEQGRDNAWDTYTGKSSDPPLGGSRKGYIIGVENTAEKRISLIHRDRDGARMGPVFLKAGEVTNAFNGMGVAGDWEATITGGRSDAPPRVVLNVRYEIR